MQNELLGLYIPALLPLLLYVIPKQLRIAEAVVAAVVSSLEFLVPLTSFSST
jgi:hypothetical protein